MSSTAKTTFIAGTEAGVGKTLLLRSLAIYWQTYRAAQSIAIMKPIDQDDRDRLLYQDLVPHQSLDSITPCRWEPHRSAGSMNAELTTIWQELQTLMQNHTWVLLEAMGSLGYPIAPDTTLADLAWDWRLPTILVVPVRPGAIAQAVAHVALARQAKVHLKGLVLNCCQPDSADHLDDWLSPTWLRSLTQMPILGCLPYLPDPSDRSALLQAAASLELEKVFGSMPLPLGA
ncbi:MAG TPA: dethiobiotin synthase [Candidatus Obscuribacterales bacterium]